MDLHTEVVLTGVGGMREEGGVTSKINEFVSGCKNKTEVNISQDNILGVMVLALRQLFLYPDLQLRNNH